jgi:hypothetical protein
MKLFLTLALALASACLTVLGQPIPKNAFTTNFPGFPILGPLTFYGPIVVSNLTVKGGLTNESLTASTLLVSDANKKVTSFANGSGALTNDGSGNLGWATTIGGGATNAVVSINGMTNNSQVLTTSVAGVDFTITTNKGTNFFNLPTASATARGALQSSDFITFNLKQPPSPKLTNISALANSVGALTNDGSGTFGYFDLSSLTNGGGGSGTATNSEYLLNTSVAVGDTSLILDRSASFPASMALCMAIDIWTTNCELRRVASVSTSTIGFNNALKFPHTAGCRILVFDGDVHVSWWAPVGNQVANDGEAVLRATTEGAQIQAGTANSYIDGDGNGYGTSFNITLLHDFKIKHLNLKTLNGTNYTGIGTNEAVLMNSQGERYFAYFSNSISAYITVTNVPVASASTNITVNGDLRNWAASQSATTFLVNSTDVNYAATNLAAQIAAFPYLNLVSKMSDTNQIVLHGRTTPTNIVITSSSNWASVVFVTNTGVVWPVGGWAQPNQNNPSNTSVTFYPGNNAALASPLVRGKIYFLKQILSTNYAFQVGVSTNDGTLAFTDSGSGSNFVYTEALSLSKGSLSDVSVTGGGFVTNLNGIFMSLQQQSEFWKVRLKDFASGTGLKVFDSQQAIFHDVEATGCHIGIDHSGSSYLWNYGVNVESFDIAVILGSANNLYSGCHFEGPSSGGTVFQGTNGAHGTPYATIIDSVTISAGSTPFVGFDFGEDNSFSAGYTLRQVNFISDADNGSIALRDNCKHISIAPYSLTGAVNFARSIGELIIPQSPDNGTIDDTMRGLGVLGHDGRMFNVGSQRGTFPFLNIRAGTNDVAPLITVMNYAGIRGSQFGLDGGLTISNADFVVASNALADGVLASIGGTSGRVGWKSLDSIAKTNFDQVRVTNFLAVGDSMSWPMPANFDGVSDYMNRGANLNGAVVTNTGYWSGWFKHGELGVTDMLQGSAPVDGGLVVYINTLDQFVVDGFDTNASRCMRLVSSATYADNQWHHVAASWDTTHTNYMLFSDGTNALNIVTSSNQFINLVATDYTIGTRGDPFGKFTGCMLEPVFGLQLINLTNSIGQFYTNGLPVSGGLNGALFNGTQPLIYFRAWTGVNSGSGGDFTVNGTLSDSCPNPFPAPPKVTVASTNANQSLVQLTILTNHNNDALNVYKEDVKVFSVNSNGTINATASNIRTNIALMDVVTNDFVLNTRYTNENRRAMLAASVQLTAAAAGTATVSLLVEHGPTTITNRMKVSAGPLASLVTIEPLTLMIGPGSIYYLTNETSGVGASASVVAGTCSLTKW